MLFTGAATEVISGSPDAKMVLVFLLEFLTILKFSGFRQQNKSCAEIGLFLGFLPGYKNTFTVSIDHFIFPTQNHLLLFWQLSLLLEGLNLDSEVWHLLVLVPTSMSSFTV